MNSGFSTQPLHTPEVARANRSKLLERRERFEQAHPEVSITTRREGKTAAVRGLRARQAGSCV